MLTVGRPFLLKVETAAGDGGALPLRVIAGLPSMDGDEEDWLAALFAALRVGMLKRLRGRIESIRAGKNYEH